MVNVKMIPRTPLSNRFPKTYNHYLGRRLRINNPTKVLQSRQLLKLSPSGQGEGPKWRTWWRVKLTRMNFGKKTTSTSEEIWEEKMKININLSTKPAARVETSSIAILIWLIRIQAKGEERKARKLKGKSKEMVRENLGGGQESLKKRLKNKMHQIANNRTIMKLKKKRKKFSNKSLASPMTLLLSIKQWVTKKNPAR